MHPAPTRHLVGGATIRELEKRDRELRQRAARADRIGLALRMVTLLILVAAVAGVGMSWRRLSGDLSAADRNLQAIHFELDTQLTEVIRYVPLQEKTEQSTRRNLEGARAELVSPDLRARVRGIRTARQFLALRMPRAKTRVRLELTPLYDDFVNRYRHSEDTVRNRTRDYNAAAAQYNRSAKPFPAGLIRRLLGYPEALPPIK